MSTKDFEIKKLSAQARAQARWFAGKEHAQNGLLVRSSNIEQEIASLVEAEEVLLDICKVLLSRVQNLEEVVKVLSQETLLMKQCRL